MPLKMFKCSFCGAERESFKKQPKCNHNQDEEGFPHPLVDMEELLTAPNLKFMEPKLKEKGMSQMKDQGKILKERAKEHARANDYHDLTQENNSEMAKRQGWTNDDGTIRKRIDDI